MALLARAEPTELERIGAEHGPLPTYRLPRPTEVGLTMVRGRVGGSGSRFNLGEMTVTRSVVQLADQTTGVAYIMGRDRHKAEMAALLDACLQTGQVPDSALAPIRDRLSSAQARRDAAVASTKVEFFTLVRGED